MSKALFCERFSTMVLPMVICFWYNTLYAQTANRTYYVEVLAGASIPVGRFNSNHYSDSGAGLANPGANANINLGYKLSDNLSVLLTVGGSHNSLNEEAFEKQKNQNSMPGTYSKVKVDNWKIVKLMLGGKYIWNKVESNKILLSSSLLFGIAKTALPEYRGVTLIAGSNMLNGSFEVEKKQLGWNLCYQISSGINYSIKSPFYLLGDISFFSSKAVYRDNINPDFPSPRPPMPYELDYGLSSINLTIGVGIHL